MQDEPLTEGGCAAHPMDQFDDWYTRALQAGGLPEHTRSAVTLATADARGHPSARVVLLKSHDRDGFVFFTNYESRKGRELAENPWASLVFWWPALNRQVRAEGPVARIPTDESTAYFATRPYGSQIGAWASGQSRVIGSRAELEESLEMYRARYQPGEVPCPPQWGGYRLTPEAVEFWQDRDNRLHDRIRYVRTEDSWRIERLAP